MRLVLALILCLNFLPEAGAQEQEPAGQMDLASTLPPGWAQGKGFNDDSRSKAAKWLRETMGDENARSPAAAEPSSDNSGANGIH